MQISTGRLRICAGAGRTPACEKLFTVQPSWLVSNRRRRKCQRTLQKSIAENSWLRRLRLAVVLPCLWYFLEVKLQPQASALRSPELSGKRSLEERTSKSI